MLGFSLFTVAVALIECKTAEAVPAVNFDTAWTYVYDGGKLHDSSAIDDLFSDVAVMADGSCYFVGSTKDSANWRWGMLVKLDANGKKLWLKRFARSGSAQSIVIARNRDLLIGGERGLAPFIMRADTAGNLRWSTWYFDSVRNANRLLRNATVNCLRETGRGTIICAAGDAYPDNFGLPLKNYAAYLELDSAGKMKNWGESLDMAGYDVGGFDIEETKTGNYLLSGNQNIFYMDSTGAVIWQKKYGFSLTGVGTEINNINRAKMLRDGSLMVMGQAYEGNCWTRYKTLYYDAWWSPISYSSGTNATWDTAGKQGGDDVLYDFTQLIDGKLLFVGVKASTEGGVWTVVTDSTGKLMLWEKQFQVPYKTEDGRAARALSVRATKDSGFTVAGQYPCLPANGGLNAFAAHFVLAGPAAIGRGEPAASRLAKPASCRFSGRNLVFRCENRARNPVLVSLYSLSGKRLAVSRSAGTATFNCSNMQKGVCLYTVTTGTNTLAGRCVVVK